MRKLMTIIALFIVTTAHAQSRVTKDANGNYHAQARQVQDSVSANKPTGKTFTDSKGKTYLLYLSSRGKLYYMRTSRNGNVYKCYLHVTGVTED